MVAQASVSVSWPFVFDKGRPDFTAYNSSHHRPPSASTVPKGGQVISNYLFTTRISGLDYAISPCGIPNPPPIPRNNLGYYDRVKFIAVPGS